MDNGTIKEICDVVTSEVMKQVQSNLSDMKPELIRSVTEAAARQAAAAAEQSAENRCRRLEQRIAQLESAFQSVKSRCDGLEKHAELLESRIAKLTATPPTPVQPKAERIPARAVDGITTLSAAQIDDILSYPCFYREANGWIYYIKVLEQGYSGYGELYKVKPDGTQNQKISSERVSTSSTDTDPIFASMGAFHIIGDKLQFKDTNGNKRVIRV